jgi:hypothetical protein
VKKDVYKSFEFSFIRRPSLMLEFELELTKMENATKSFVEESFLLACPGFYHLLYFHSTLKAILTK